MRQASSGAVADLPVDEADPLDQVERIDAYDANGTPLSTKIEEPAIERDAIPEA